MTQVHGDWGLRDELAAVLLDKTINDVERERRLGELVDLYLGGYDDDDIEGLSHAIDEWVIAVLEILGSPSRCLH